MRSLLIALLLSAPGVAVAQELPAQATPAHPSDAEVATWFKFRQQKFGELKTADPNQPAALATLKARAAAEVAAAGPLASPDAPPVTWPLGLAKPPVILDDPAAPRMVVVPAGEFTMGSRAGEPGHAPGEGPRRRVRIAAPFAASMFPVVHGEYALFVADTHRAPSGPCASVASGPLAVARRDWRDTGFPQTVRHPATCVGYQDAVAYADWLTRKTGHRYRLLSEAEYEYVDRAGTTTAYWWGDDANAACAYANGFDEDAQAANPAAASAKCHDGHAFTAPVGSFKPNAFGLFDMSGNVASWTADCWADTLARVPVDGSPNTRGDCRFHAVRGGFWASADLRAAARDKRAASYVGTDTGFRVAREL